MDGLTFYEMKPFEPGRPFELDDDGMPVTEEQVGAYEGGWHNLTVASELWGLIDDPRKEAIEALQRRLDRAATVEDRPIRFKAADLEEAIRLLSGIPDDLVGKVIDKKWFIPLERIDEIRRRAPSLDLRPARPDAELVQAVAEGIVRAMSVRNVLTRVHRAGHEIIAD